MSKDKRSMATPARSSKRGYQGTSQFSHICISDIRCLWCLEVGHDFHHCPNEDVKVVDSTFNFDAKPVDDSNVEVDTPIVSHASTECCVVEGELLDDVQVVSFAQLSTNVICIDESICYELREKENGMAEKESDKKDKMVIDEKKELCEKEAQQTKKEIICMAQKSEDERFFILNKPLHVHLCKVGLFYFIEIAGSIPSIVKLYLQDCGKRMKCIDLPSYQERQDLRTNLFKEREYDMNLASHYAFQEPIPIVRLKMLNVALHPTNESLETRLEGFGLHHNQVDDELEACDLARCGKFEPPDRGYTDVYTGSVSLTFEDEKYRAYTEPLPDLYTGSVSFTFGREYFFLFRVLIIIA
ncbi:uncharacterized protein LOC142552188 isoform X3 [Primulina tabacum]|uniref:uncharacterized protein LOC142552188 isoform X3 n=1 Tax=Primulina tabacum TaxID=48773 RepID=UPI003F5A0E85